MELRDLRYYCTIIETKNVTKAADKLGSSQPFLTKVIRQIESELEIQLFKKSGRFIEPNEIGEALYIQAKRVLQDMENLYTEIDYLTEKTGRTITLLCNTEAYTPQMILNFNKSNLTYSIAVLYASRDEIIKSLKTDSTTCAICCPPITNDFSNDIVTENAFYDTGRILLPPNHPLLEKKSITLDDLRNERLVTSPKGSALRCVIEPIYKDLGINMNIICESNNLHVITCAVENGMGYAFMPSVYLNERPELYKHTVEEDVPEEQKKVFFGLSHNKSLDGNRNFEHFKNFILNYFAEFQTIQNLRRSESGFVKDNGNES